jgi:hypothetical protein
VIPSLTCSEPLVWTCKACGHSFHTDEWQAHGRQCPACSEKGGEWKCSLCMAFFSQPSLNTSHPCRSAEHAVSAENVPPLLDKGLAYSLDKKVRPPSSKGNLLYFYICLFFLGLIPLYFAWGFISNYKAQRKSDRESSSIALEITAKKGIEKHKEMLKVLDSLSAKDLKELSISFDDNKIAPTAYQIEKTPSMSSLAFLDSILQSRVSIRLDDLFIAKVKLNDAERIHASSHLILDKFFTESLLNETRDQINHRESIIQNRKSSIDQLKTEDFRIN